MKKLFIRISLLMMLLAALAAAAQQSTAPPSSATPPVQSATQATAYTPQYKGDPAHSQSEAIALGYMHTLLVAQRLYLKKHAHYATSLYALANFGSGSFTKRMMNTDRGDYTVSFHGGEKKFSLQLTPKQFDAQHRAFWTNENGIIHVDNDDAATERSPVLKAGD